MQLIITILYIITILVGLAYLVLIAMYCYGWANTPTYQPDQVTVYIKSVVVIAVRNEERNIEKCLHALTQQNYPLLWFDIIIVDDNSADNTVGKVKQLQQLHPNIKLIQSTGEGKKAAITTAVNSTDAELIITTDADCVMDKNWLYTIVSFYQKTKARMICAPVCFHEEKNLFEKMQTLELMSLVTSGAASLYFNKATLCNGANLAYTKETFMAVNGFEGIDHTPSGDDVLLLYKVNHRFKNSVKFLKHSNAIVYTKAQENLKQFINQRKRWLSKDFKCFNTATKITGTIVFLFNSILLLMLLLSLSEVINPTSNYTIGRLTCFLLAIKCIIDFLLLFLASSFYQKRHLLLYFLPEEVIYLLYVASIGLISFFNKGYEWKGRKTIK